MEVYRSSDSPGEFHNAIIKFRSPLERCGSSKKVNEEPDQNTSTIRQEMAETELLDRVGVT